MPEETITRTDVQSALQNLEDHRLSYSKPRLQNYKIIKSALETDEHFSAEELKRLLAVCVHDTPTMKYTSIVISIIPSILSKLEVNSYDPPPDLVPSAVAVVNMLTTIALLGKVESLMTLCLDALLSYPEDTLVTVTERHYQDVIELFNLYCHTRIQVPIRLQACKLLYKILKILPQDKKKEFVECGVSVWFSKIIPTVMNNISAVSSNTEILIEILELLTDDLVLVDYTNNSSWHNILECICIAKQYPAIMKALLHAGNDAWHRLWIVFIRLLKHQITQPLSSVGSPINSMLPVVEAAFKLDVTNRCRAFECWNVLIDSFATDTNESNVNKRLKLLILPLKSNNAKAEETAIAKFKCWWNLIRKFQNIMDKFLDTVLVSFLNFCFGRHNAVDKSVFIPGHITANVKKYCNEALVEMIGHVNCDSCTNLPKLKFKIINTKHLVDNWNHWIFSLTSVIMRTPKNDSGLTKQQMKCLWTSFLMTIGELPENNVRKDLFAEILFILTRLVQECKSNNEFLDIVFNILIQSMFEKETKIKELFRSDNDPNDPIIRIFKIILDSSFYGFYDSIPPRELVTKFKKVTNLMLDEEVCNSTHSIGWLLRDMPTNDYGLLLWTALAESTYESEYDSSLVDICNIVLWPLISLHLFTNVKISAVTWYTTYDLLYPKLNKTNIDEEVSEILFSAIDDSGTAMYIYFKLCIVLGVLKHKFTKDKSMACVKEINLLLNLTKGIHSYEYFDPIMPMLVDRIVAIMSIVTSSVNETVTALILICVKNVLHVLIQTCKQQSHSESTVDHIMLLIANLLQPLEKLFAVESYAKLIPAMTYNLFRCSPFLSEHSSTRSIFLSVMKSIFKNTKYTDMNYNKIKTLIEDIENTKLHTIVKNVELSSESNNFFTPEEVPKQNKKKEASIVNTVVENGEEYVVVRSNWKFNPRKLTENQKEKLQRKREDIPALYQDLSQSQDEFKLVSWKTDSQDTTSSSKSESKSNSKPSNNESAAEVLKNLSSPNLVPKILENILLESDKDVNNAKNLPSKDNVRRLEVTTPTIKNSKSPRITLKDRIFRNWINLIEGSSLQKENKDSNEDSNKTDNYGETPSSNKNSVTNVANSAPTLLSADRPSRVKRKPKKFEDLELLTPKKRRHSCSESHIGKAESLLNHKTSKNQRLQSSEDVDESDIIIIENVSENYETNTPKNLGDDSKMICHDEQNRATESNIVTLEFSDDQVCKSHENNTSIQQASVMCDDAIKESDRLSEPTFTKSKIITEVLILDTSPNGRQLSTPELSKSDSQLMPALNCEETLVSKENKEVSTLISKVSTTDSKEMSNRTKGPTPKALKGDNSVTLPIAMKDLTEVSSRMTNDIKQVLSPKISENVQDSAIPKTLKDANQVSPLTKCNNVIEVSTTTTSIDTKEIETSEPSQQISKPILTKNGIESSNIELSEVLSTPKLSKESKDVMTPVYKESKDDMTSKQAPKVDESKSTTKKNIARKSRIEKELAIDTVEGHPLLKILPGKRLTRKALETTATGRRKSLADKLYNSKLEGITPLKTVKKTKDKSKRENSSSFSVVVNESQEQNAEQREHSSFSDELPNSEDFIESSQDSTITNISVKSTKKSVKKVPVVCVEKLTNPLNKISEINTSQSIIDHIKVDVTKPRPVYPDCKDDSVLPLNKTALEDSKKGELTENMDTEPFEDKNISDDVILVNSGVPILTVASDVSILGPESQEIAEADTQPTDPNLLMNADNLCETSEISLAETKENHIPETCSEENDTLTMDQDQFVVDREMYNTKISNTVDDTTITLSESVCGDLEPASSASSPFKDEAQRQQDFMNNTVEISPIKTMSPDRNKRSPSPETSSDYVVIKLTSPVHSNGEPFDKVSSPEVFTEEKVSPDKRDQSPPRGETNVTTTSPNSSLSLKKNRPQVRSGGRAAHMLGLCVPEKVQAIVNLERNEPDNVKTNSSNTPARRNLRTLYNSVGEYPDTSSGASDNDDSENFLKFRRSLPGTDCSPSGPILKRKLAEITDDTVVSPASKRKRVSFHDPPVSTTISVQKYIEPGVLRSPQNSAHKRLERQMRQYPPQKSPKRLDKSFKLDTVLNKAVESFSVGDIIVIPDDTEALSLDETPVAEIVRTSELNDTDPICSELLGCKDPIENIASDLSSPAMKSLLIKELKGRIDTIGDLAKLTELEVNRLCIKAPKLTVAKKVLTDYVSKQAENFTIEEAAFAETMTEPQNNVHNIEVQTDNIESIEMEVQTEEMPTRELAAQTEAVLTAHSCVQTQESGSTSTKDVIKLCLSEKISLKYLDHVALWLTHIEDDMRPDFVDALGECLEESSIKQLSEKLLVKTVTDLLMKKITPSDTRIILDRILEQENNSSNDKTRGLSFIRDYLCDKYVAKDLLLLFSEVVNIVYDKPT